MTREEVVRESEEQAACVCPYCEGLLEMTAPWCAVCEVEIRLCGYCEEPLPQEATTCPSCGADCEE